MTAPTQLGLPPAPHSNRQLFSDYYLNVILPERADWKQLIPAAQSAMTRIAAIYDRYTPSDNEAQTERDLIHPILSALGHPFEVQPALKTPDGAKRPDVVFFNDQAAVAAHKDHILTDESLRATAYAVGDAKHWNRPLDITIPRRTNDPFTNKNPSYQIAFYVQHSGLPWGLLTNGKHWRLYHRDTAHKLDRFYEVDLQALLASAKPSEFLYFFAFFRRAAFEPDNPLGLVRIFKESVDYARAIGNSLKAQVFDALRHLGQGFLDFPANNLDTDPTTLKAVYDNTLILLYRLLFIFYAEARGLLPLRGSETYRDSYSLHALTRQVAGDLDHNRRLLATRNRIWHRLRELFQIINDGHPDLSVATFNGGLFDPARHPFLEQHAVGDAQLQSALDALARVKGQFVDYRDLAEQHLGTIYEGLLEHHFAEIPEEHGWRIDVVNERGERKRTGVYYTPDFIVKYIVAHTLESLLDAAVAGKEDDAKVDAVLNVNVLDPAMGSAYFLVEATEYIARFLVDRALPPADGLPSRGIEGSEGGATDRESDLAYWKRRVVQNCIYGVDINPLAVDLAKLSLWLATAAKDRPLSFLDHHLRTGNALVGARVSDPQQGGPRGKPKAGSKERRAADAGQLSMLDDPTFTLSMQSAVSSMWLIEESAGDTVEQVKEQETLYEDLRLALTRGFGQQADLQTARRFGLGLTPDDWQGLITYAKGQSLLALPQTDHWLATVADLARDHRFFHWDLEFPEIFFDRFGRPLRDAAGFHAVIGNPPYVRQERLTPIKPYLGETFASYNSVADLYIYFYERGIQLLRNSGKLGYISSGTFARANFAKAFREYLPTAAQIEQVIDFGENQPFEGAEMVRPSIVILNKGEQAESFRSLLITGKIPSSLDDAMIVNGVESDAAAMHQPEWVFQSAANTRLFQRIVSQGRLLADVVDGRLYMGIKTGLAEAFVVDGTVGNALVANSPDSAQIIRPTVAGQDLRPWYQENEERWLIRIPAGWTRQTIGAELSAGDAWKWLAKSYPNLATHLSPFAAAASGRYDKGEYWWELRSCDYYDAFDQTKIIWPDIAKLPRFSQDDAGTYLNNTAYFIPTDDQSLLGILQSRVIWFVISQISQPLRERAGLWQYRLFPQFLERLPIPDLSSEDRVEVAGLATQLGVLTRDRYNLHRKARNRIVSDFGSPGTRLNQKLTAWWTLDFSAFRAEVKKALKADIPVKERDQWEDFLTTNRADHDRLAAAIVARETDLNARVYALFALSLADIRLIEESTKYPYGEV